MKRHLKLLQQILLQKRKDANNSVAVAAQLLTYELNNIKKNNNNKQNYTHTCILQYVAFVGLLFSHLASHVIKSQSKEEKNKNFSTKKAQLL